MKRGEMVPDSGRRGSLPVLIFCVAPIGTGLGDTWHMVTTGGRHGQDTGAGMTREWTLQRNCSLSPRQVARAYAVLCLGSLAVAAGFLANGIWLVLAFSLLELALVGLALLVYARHATDHERIALSESGLLVTCVQANRRELVRLDPLWTRVVVPDERRRALVRLESRGVKVEIGRFVDDARRRQVARELRLALRSVSAMPPS